MDATVEAGVARLQLDRALRPEGVFFPVDPGADATLGGHDGDGRVQARRQCATATMRENVRG